jgi:hypothetical protein
MAGAEPPFEQRLRADGAEQRELHGGGHDPPDTEAAGQGSVNLTKQALKSYGGTTFNGQGALLGSTIKVPKETAKFTVLEFTGSVSNEDLSWTLAIHAA